MITARLAELKKPRGLGGAGLSDDDTPVLDAKRKLDAVDAEMKRLNQLLEVRRARSRDLAALVANCEDWVRIGRPGGTVLVEAANIDIATVLKKGETTATALDRLRRLLRELDADERRVECAPFPSAHAKAKMRLAIEQLADRGTPDVGPLVEAGHEISWPWTMQRLGLSGIVGKDGSPLAGHAMGEVVDVHALIAWLYRDDLIAKLEAEIDETSDDAAALSPEERKRRLAEIAADKLASEREECALVRHLQDEGLPVEHRPDSDPRAVLGVEVVVATTAPIAAPYGEAARAVEHAARLIQIEPPTDAT